MNESQWLNLKFLLFCLESKSEWYKKINEGNKMPVLDKEEFDNLVANDLQKCIDNQSKLDEEDEENDEDQYDYQDDREYIFDDLGDIHAKLFDFSMKIERMGKEIFDLKLRIRPKSPMMESQNLAAKNEIETQNQEMINHLEQMVQKERLEIIGLKKELARVRDTHNKLKRTYSKEKVMPLVKAAKARTRKGFSDNVKKEMDAGKPQKQAVAIAYSEARGKKKRK